MNHRLGFDYPWLLSRTLETEDPSKWGRPVLSSASQRVAFYLGVLTFGSALLPLTLAAFIYHVHRPRAEPNPSPQRTATCKC